MHMLFFQKGVDNFETEQGAVTPNNEQTLLFKDEKNIAITMILIC